MCFCITLNIKGDLSSEEISPMTTFKLVASPQNKFRILTLFFFFFMLKFIYFQRIHNSVIVWILPLEISKRNLSI